MRRIRISQPRQLCLPWEGSRRGGSEWELLPEATRAAALSLLARLIARSVVVEGDRDG